MKHKHILVMGQILWLLACASAPKGEDVAEHSKLCYEESSQALKEEMPIGRVGRYSGGVFIVDIPLGNDPSVYAECMQDKGYQLALPIPSAGGLSQSGHFIIAPTQDGGHILRWSGGSPPSP